MSYDGPVTGEVMDNTIDACASTSVGGKRLKLAVKVNGVKIGEVIYRHLKSFPLPAPGTTVSPGAQLGLLQADANDPNYYQGVHCHMDWGGQTSSAIYPSCVSPILSGGATLGSIVG